MVSLTKMGKIEMDKNMCVYACGRSNTGHIEFEMSARCAGQDGNSVLVVWV